MLVSRHSDRAAARPRRKKRSTPRLNLVSANTGNHALAFGVERAGLVGGQDAPHERAEPAVPARPRAGALVGVGGNEDRHSVTGEAFDLDFVPVAGVGQHRRGRSSMPARSSSRRAAAIIGSSWPKSAEEA